LRRRRDAGWEIFLATHLYHHPKSLSRAGKVYATAPFRVQGGIRIEYAGQELDLLNHVLLIKKSILTRQPIGKQSHFEVPPVREFRHQTLRKLRARIFPARHSRHLLVVSLQSIGPAGTSQHHTSILSDAPLGVKRGLVHKRVRQASHAHVVLECIPLNPRLLRKKRQAGSSIGDVGINGPQGLHPRQQLRRARNEAAAMPDEHHLLPLKLLLPLFLCQALKGVGRLKKLAKIFPKSKSIPPSYGTFVY